MKSLNEKLAEVCGKEVYPNSEGVLQEYNPMMGNNTPIWNPTTDLNQLRECYLALSEDEKEIYKSVSSYDVPHILDDPARHAKYIATIRERTILKAKEVS